MGAAGQHRGLGVGTAVLATAIGAPLGLRARAGAASLQGVAAGGACRAAAAAALRRRARVDVSRRQPRAAGDGHRIRPALGVDLQPARRRAGARPGLVSPLDAGHRGRPPPDRWTARGSRLDGGGATAACSGASRCRSWRRASWPPGWSSSSWPCPSSACRASCVSASTRPRSSRPSPRSTTRVARRSWRCRCWRCAWPWPSWPSRFSATASSSARRGAETPVALRLARSVLRHGGDRGRSRHGAGPAAGRARAGGAGQPVDRHRPRGVRRGDRQQPPAGDARRVGRRRHRDVAGLRAGPGRRPRRSARRRRAGRAVRHAWHAGRRGPDWRMESPRTARRVVWDRQHARARLPRAPPPGRGPRARRECPHGTRVARRGRGRQRRGMASHHVAHRRAADASRHSSRPG